MQAIDGKWMKMEEKEVVIQKSGWLGSGADWYCIISFCVALRAEMGRIFVVAGSGSDQR